MLNGIGASNGIGIGKIVLLKEEELSYEKHKINDTVSELERYRKAVADFTEKTNILAEKIGITAGEKEAEILKGHILMIQDPFMNDEIEKLIKKGECAEYALENICDMFIGIFSAADDELTQQRAADVSDLKKRLLKILLGIEDIDISAVLPDTVLCVSDLTPSMTAGIDRENIVGIITEIGGTTSHSAIIARALEIPAVLGVKNAVDILKNGSSVIVDGTKGNVIANPSESEIAEYTIKKTDFLKEKTELQKYIGQTTKTSDGIQVELVCNIGNPKDADKVLQYDGEGVGLFRTEFLFMDRPQTPSEDEQFEAYKTVAMKMEGRPVIIRTLDVGGDKDIPYLNMSKEDNPFLGYRAVRYCLGNKKLYSAQLKALLRASAFGNIKIMIPMVSCIEEVREVKSLIRELKRQLDTEKIAYNKNIPIGVMIETPSASIIADILAKEADFFSIGTNDLTQYTMAVDRGNSNVSYLYSVFNPSVLRSIKHIITCAKTENIPVGMCGEAAADKMLIPLLLSFGLDEFSVSATSVLATRKAISEWSKQSANKIAEKVMQFSTADEVKNYLKEKMTELNNSRGG